MVEHMEKQRENETNKENRRQSDLVVECKAHGNSEMENMLYCKRRKNKTETYKNISNRENENEKKNRHTPIIKTKRKKKKKMSETTKKKWFCFINMMSFFDRAMVK